MSPANRKCVVKRGTRATTGVATTNTEIRETPRVATAYQGNEGTEGSSSHSRESSTPQPLELDDAPSYGEGSSVGGAYERDRKRKNEATFREKESYARNELSQVLQERMQDDGEVWEEGLSFRKCLWFSAEQMRKDKKTIQQLRDQLVNQAASYEQQLAAAQVRERDLARRLAEWQQYTAGLGGVPQQVPTLTSALHADLTLQVLAQPNTSWQNFVSVNSGGMQVPTASAHPPHPPRYSYVLEPFQPANNDNTS